MASKEYPKVPTAKKQIITTILILVICTLGFFFLNKDLEFSAETKRFLSRAGGYIVLAGGLLGGFGFIWNKKNKIKLSMAQQDLNDYNASITALKENDAVINALKENDAAQTHQSSIKVLEFELGAAKSAISEATDFEDTVAKVGIAALFFLTIGTILQILGV